MPRYSKPAPTRGSKPGERRGGRVKGQPNKVTAAAKDAIVQTFVKMGGVENLTKWARLHQKEFYTIIWPKIIPLQVGGDPDNPIVTEIRQTIVRS